MRLNLKDARKSKKLTQAYVAKYLGVATNHYQRIESGENGTSEENWLKLFNLFEGKVPLHKLMEKSAARSTAC